MNSNKILFRTVMAITLVIIHITCEAEARPGLLPVQELFYAYPSASQQTTVIRDLLGNQGTAYAYQNSNGISSSSVAVSRSDNSKTLAFVPAVAPVIAEHQPLLHNHYGHDHHAHLDHYQAAISPAVAYSDYHAYV